MLVIVKRIVCGRTLGVVAVGTQRYFEYAYGISYHIEAARNLLAYVVHGALGRTSTVACALLYLQYCTTVLLNYCTTVLLYYCTTVLLYHCTTADATRVTGSWVAESIFSI